MTDTVSQAAAPPPAAVASRLKPVLLSALSGLTQSSLWLLNLHLMPSSYPCPLNVWTRGKGEASGRAACGPKPLSGCWGPGAGRVSPP